MIKKFETIPEIMEYMLDRHKFISQQKAGGYGVVMLRKANGRRIIVQEMRYFRIFKHQMIDSNSVMVYNIITGLSFKGSSIQSSSSTLYLNDLVQINVYDHSTHFVSRVGIDFSYLEEDQSATVQALQEFIHDKPGVIRASWTDKNASEDDLLDAMSFGVKKSLAEPYRRHIAIDCGEM